MEESDHVLCNQISRIDSEYAAQNARETCTQWHDLREDKDFLAEGQLLVARRAGCGDVSARANSGPEGGWLMSVCPVPTYANQVVGSNGLVCAPRHQAFMNQTRRGTGTDSSATRRGAQ